MLAIAASFLFAAFPVRGSVLRSLDSVLVIDRDTVRTNLMQCPCLCPGIGYEVALSRDSVKKIRPFPGTTYPSGSVAIAGRSGKFKGLDPSGHFPICSTMVSISPENVRRFVLHGVADDWAVWADSVYQEIETTRTYDTTGGIISVTLHEKETFRARWRWSRIDTAVPWVRWVDTVPLVRLTAPKGLPVLTTLRPFGPDSIVPNSNGRTAGILLQSKVDSVSIFDWGSRGTLAVLPGTEVPAGRTFRVLDAYNLAGGTIQLQFLSAGKVVDGMKMTGQATTKIQRTVTTSSARSGTVGYEPATGRRIRLDSPLPVGKRLLTGLAGTRLIVVE